MCGISCGGIHNAVYTESGQVYTWGCSDDGSLGRVGEESVPILVDVSGWGLLLAYLYEERRGGDVEYVLLF